MSQERQTPQSEQDRHGKKRPPLLRETVGQQATEGLGEKKSEISEGQGPSHLSGFPVKAVGKIDGEKRHDARLDIADQEIDPQKRKSSRTNSGCRLLGDCRNRWSHRDHPGPG